MDFVQPEVILRSFSLIYQHSATVTAALGYDEPLERALQNLG
jgi:hypothetical protein